MTRSPLCVLAHFVPCINGRRTTIAVAWTFALVTAPNFLAAEVLAAEPAPLGAAEIRIERDDQRLDTSVRIAQGTYRQADAHDDGIVQISGSRVVVNFQGATLDGAQEGTAPDQFAGRGIFIENASEVTIRNARVRGFKVGLYARNCRKLTIENCDFSDNWKQRLQSTPQAESGADWLFGHENDNNEWLRYGAALYLDNCEGFLLRGNRGQRGQNGICLVRSRRGSVVDNDFSFNSGWGLALYRSSHQTVDHNKFDWCIRGYSHGIYNRGQDSAGILVFEQCSHNVFAFNSATHGGDGFFLFAGLETLDETGDGGCNHNLVYGNDFSHASNNGIEATFSTGNQFIANIMDQADHAIWAGYSYGSRFEHNVISRCNHGISIEHGSDNHIVGNQLRENGVALNLWANESSSFAAKPYGKEHHCRSEGYVIASNVLKNNQVDLRLGRTERVAFQANDCQGAKVSVEVHGPSRDIRIASNNLEGELRTDEQSALTWQDNFYRGPVPEGVTNRAEPYLSSALQKDVQKPDPPADLSGRLDPFLPPDTPRGLQYIFVDEWGPYDFSHPKVIPNGAVFWNEARMHVLGLKRPYRVQHVAGDVQVVIDETTAGGAVLCRVTAADRRQRAFAFDLASDEHKEPVKVRGLLLFADWNVKFYAWKRVGAGQPPADWPAVIAGPVLEERKLPEINFAWGGRAPSDKVPAAHFAAVGTTEIDLPAGKYRVRTVSDDGIRVSVDGRRVIDNWTWHGPTEDNAEVDLKSGTHPIRIEYFQIDGASQLQFWIEPLKK